MLGVPVTQVAALLYIAKDEGCLLRDLSVALGLKHPATTGLISRMEKNDLIERRACNDDARASRIYLTEQGKNKLPVIFPLIDQFNEQLIKGFSQEEIAVVVRFLGACMQDTTNK